MPVQVRRACLWSVQPEVVKLLGEDSKRCSCRLLLADVEVKLRVGVEGFRLRIALKRWQTRNRAPFVAVLDGFCERNRFFTIGPENVIRGVAAAMPMIDPSSLRRRGTRFWADIRNLLKSPVRVSTLDTAPVNLPYLGL
jgi:hypothetical protein